MQPPEKKDDAADLFARPSPWGRPPLPTLRVGALPRTAGAPMRPVRTARPNVITADAAPSRPSSGILTGSLTPAAPLGGPPPRPRAPMDPMMAAVAQRAATPPTAAAPVPAPPMASPAAQPVAAAPSPFVAPAPAVSRRRAKPLGGHAPLIIGGTVVAVAGVVAFLVLAGRDAGTTVAPAPVVATQTTPPPIAPTPEPTVATPPVAAPVAKVALRPAIAPRRAATAPAVTPTPEPVVAEPAPIVLNPTPVEAPPPAAPLVLKPYTPPTAPDPEAPMVLRGSQN